MMPMMAFQNQLLAVDRATPFDRMGNEKISPMTTPGKQKKKNRLAGGTFWKHIIFFFCFAPRFPGKGFTTHMLLDPMYSQSKRPEHC